MKIGQKVLLIGQVDVSDCPPPPIGAVGEISGPIDEDGDYFVLFPGFPCPWGEPDWFVSASMLVPLDDNDRRQNAWSHAEMETV